MNGDRFDGFFDNGTKTNRGVINYIYFRHMYIQMVHNIKENGSEMRGVGMEL